MYLCLLRLPAPVFACTSANLPESAFTVTLFYQHAPVLTVRLTVPRNNIVDTRFRISSSLAAAPVFARTLTEENFSYVLRVNPRAGLLLSSPTTNWKQSRRLSRSRTLVTFRERDDTSIATLILIQVYFANM